MMSLKPLAITMTGAFTMLAAGSATAWETSSADVLSASFVASGTTTFTPAVAPAGGFAPPAYNVENALPGYTNTLNIAGTSSPPIALYSQLTAIFDHASAVGGLQGATSIAEADTAIGDVTLSLNLNPPPPAPTTLPLQITASSGPRALQAVQGSVSFDGALATITGTASLGELKITGSLVGNQTLSYSGTPPADYVLFQNAEVTITLNEHGRLATPLFCTVTGGCPVLVGGIHVAAVHVQLTNATIFGRTVSGDIYLGEAQVN